MIALSLLLLAQEIASVDNADELRNAETIERNQSTDFFVAEKFAEEARKIPHEILQKIADEQLKKWRICLKEFSSKASLSETDPTPVVVSIAFKACKDERSNAEWAWAQSILIGSRFKPKMITAYRWAKEAFEGFAVESNDNLLVAVSYERQIRYFQNESNKLKAK